MEFNSTFVATNGITVRRVSASSVLVSNDDTGGIVYILGSGPDRDRVDTANAWRQRARSLHTVASRERHLAVAEFIEFEDHAMLAAA